MNHLATPVTATGTHLSQAVTVTGPSQYNPNDMTTHQELAE